MNAGEILYPVLENLVNQRVYPLIAPEGSNNELPYIIYTPVSSIAEQTFDGIMGDEWVKVQIDIYHHDYDELLILTKQVIKAIDTTLGLKVYNGTQQILDNLTFRSLLEFEFWQAI